VVLVAKDPRRPAGVVIAGRAITALVVSLVVTALVIAIGNIAYGVRIAPRALGGVALSIAIGSLALASLGYAVSSVIGSADSAQPVTLAITLPLSFISGVYIPSLKLPSALQRIAQAFPVQHLVAALGRGFLPSSTGVAWGDLAILAGWGLAGLAVALTHFRWTPASVKA
jgi:ABC-2 type transport system permease protein